MEITWHFRKINHKLLLWLHDRSGVTSFEYAFIAGGIGMALITGMTFFSDHFNHMFQDVFSPALQERTAEAGGFLNNLEASAGE